MKNFGGNDFYAASPNGKRDGGMDEVGKKIRHKINSIQLAEYSLLLTGNISRRSLPRREQRERGFVLEGGV